MIISNTSLQKEDKQTIVDRREQTNEQTASAIQRNKKEEDHDDNRHDVHADDFYLNLPEQP